MIENDEIREDSILTAKVAEISREGSSMMRDERCDSALRSLFVPGFAEDISPRVSRAISALN